MQAYSIVEIKARQSVFKSLAAGFEPGMQGFVNQCSISLSHKRRLKKTYFCWKTGLSAKTRRAAREELTDRRETEGNQQQLRMSPGVLNRSERDKLARLMDKEIRGRQRAKNTVYELG